jgi:hypothetical protein
MSDQFSERRMVPAGQVVPQRAIKEAPTGTLMRQFDCSLQAGEATTLDATQKGGIPLDDPHQVSALIATAICDWRKDQSDPPLSPEQAKHLAKCIIQALSDAGLQISPANAPKKE